MTFWRLPFCVMIWVLKRGVGDDISGDYGAGRDGGDFLCGG